MKKKLLFMLTLILAALPAFSDKKDVDIKTLFGNNGSIARFSSTSSSKTSGDFTFTFTKTGAGTYQYNGRSYKPLSGIQMGAGNTMEITCKEGTGIKISKLVFALHANTNATSAVINGDDVTVSGSSLTWEGTPSETITMKTGDIGSDQLIFTSVELTYSQSGESTTTPAPVISPKSGSYFGNLTVTITPGEGSPEGTVIYYTNGYYSMSINDVENPTSSSTQYTEPLVLTPNSRKQVVKAIAIAPGKDPSEVVFGDYTVTAVYSCNSIRQYLTSAIEGNVYEMAAECTVVYQNGQVLFVTDGFNGLYICNAPSGKYKEGDVISGFTGRYASYRTQSGMMGITDSFKDAIRNESYTWTNATYANLSPIYADTNSFPYAVNTVYFDNKAQSEDENNPVIGSLVFANGDKVALYNTNDLSNLGLSTMANTVDFPVEAGWYDVKGVTSLYNTESMFIPFSFVAATAEKTADPVFQPESGKYEVPFDVTVTSATEGAVIRYTDDESVPTMDSPLLTDKLTIDRDVTLKAFAVAQGYLPSEVIEVVYSKKTGIESIDADAADAEYFDMLGRRVSNPADGLYIKRANGATTKVLVK